MNHKTKTIGVHIFDRLSASRCSRIRQAQRKSVVIFLILIFINCISRQIPIPKERLIQSILESKKLERKKISYLIFKPNSYYTGNTKNLPLVLFLHGRGERGNDLELVKRQALPKMIAEGNTEFPFIVRIRFEYKI